jgi:TonB family protein
MRRPNCSLAHWIAFALLSCLASCARDLSRPARIEVINSTCRPEYPPASVRAGATGTTGLSFVVDVQGHVGQATIVQASGSSREHRLLDQAARASLARCPAQPALDSTGHPFDSVVKVSYVWRLD